MRENIRTKSKLRYLARALGVIRKEKNMSLLKTAKMMLGYMAWANKITITSVARLPDSELYKDRNSHFGNIVSTLNHIYVVEDVFKAHLTGEKHGYTHRNTDKCPTINELSSNQEKMDRWYMDYISNLDEKALEEIISFEYIGGGKGDLSIYEIILHLVNHAANHRGHVSEMMYKTDFKLQTHDLTVYLRDVHKYV